MPSESREHVYKCKFGINYSYLYTPDLDHPSDTMDCTVIGIRLEPDSSGKINRQYDVKTEYGRYTAYARHLKEKRL